LCGDCFFYTASKQQILERYVLDNFKDIPPSIAGMVMAVFIAAIRVIYDQEETSLTRIILESLLCGALALTAGSAIDALGYDKNWTLFAGGVIGFMGSQSIRAFAKVYLTKRINNGGK
jgi:lambda family phage holin